MLVEKVAAAEESGRSLTANVGQVGRLRANPTHVYQLFANLIDNAVRHNDRDEQEVTITLLSEEGELHQYLVSDNGPGIPPEMIEDIFSPFVKGKTGGTGIGLATVEKKQHLQTAPGGSTCSRSVTAKASRLLPIRERSHESPRTWSCASERGPW